MKDNETDLNYGQPNVRGICIYIEAEYVLSHLTYDYVHVDILKNRRRKNVLYVLFHCVQFLGYIWL